MDSPQPRPLAIANWLVAVAALVFVMVLVGGITRLTESGLSITEWRPVSGAIPPLSAAEWQLLLGLLQRMVANGDALRDAAREPARDLA